MAAGKSDGRANNGRKPFRRKPPVTEVLYRPDKDTQILLKQTYEKLQVIFLCVKNLGVEVQELRAEQAKLRSVVLTLLADPQAQHDAIAVLKDFYNTQKR